MAAVHVPSNPTVVLSTDRSKEELKHILDVVLEVPIDGPAREALINNGIETAHSLRVLSDDEIDGLQRLDKNNTTRGTKWISVDTPIDELMDTHTIDDVDPNGVDGSLDIHKAQSNRKSVSPAAQGYMQADAYRSLFDY